ncbi:hypothetical protein F3Y22_tig00111149pilonHSYRG00035 [Hibiscus syriacus]|uniref:Uncharacterized protein n=1 Tax=Hibiscus syriacus TaxID=106335 RepID=A0A6A2YXN8_HIBSY|nr:hypothetical protein F3Y22_tig00111149pilonHSYRG00035 [Hibiscus syriacus]
MEVESELKTLITVGLFTYVSLSYCYHIAAKIPKGLPRLLALLPVMVLLFIFPFKLHSIYLCHPLVLCLSCHTNFNLLSLAFDRGPLSPPKAADLDVFILTACSPFKIKQPHHSKVPLDLILEAASKGSLWIVFTLVSYSYKECFHRLVWLLIFGFQVWLAVDVLLTMVEPQGIRNAPSRRLRPDKKRFDTLNRSPMEFVAAGFRNVCRLRSDTRTAVLQHITEKPHVGDNLVLRPAWDFRGHGDYIEEEAQAEASQGHYRTTGYGESHSHFCLLGSCSAPEKSR